MENSVRDILHCEEQLRSTLYCDDKEKLRRKLAQLRREYIKTAQRLQRAEHLDAVRRHVRSRITQQNDQDQGDSAVPSNSSLLTPNKQDVPQCEGHTEGPTDSGCKRSPVIRFLLPYDAACPQTPDPSLDIDRGHRPSPAMRLRSRRSRLRWEKKSAEAGRMTDSSENGQEQSERIESSRIEAEKEEIKSQETEVVNESEELFSASESGSPSLLLTHWNTHGNTETADVEGMESQGFQEQKEKEDELAVEGENVEQNVAEKIENEKRHVNAMERKEENTGISGDGKSTGFLDSCTLVEGLLFPAEYYVRTTRRMTFSQSQPDMQAIILSQLNNGRHHRGRRGRGRGRGHSTGPDRSTQTSEHSVEQTRKDLSSLATTSVDPPKLSHVQAADISTKLTGNSQSSSEIPDQISDSQTNINAFSSPTVCTPRPGRGRRRKRGRGRGRSSPGVDTSQSDIPQPTSTPVSPSAHRPTSHLTSQEVISVTNNPVLTSSHSTVNQPSSGINEAQSNPVSGHLDKVYPIFLKSNINKSCTQLSKSTPSWQSLLLPSSPSGKTCLRPLPFQSLSSLVSNLINSDIQQDFHLPDDQFASLKLHKLRQVAMASEIESFTSPYNTRNSKRRFNTSSSDPVMPLPLPLSLTPTITDSPRFAEVEATAQSVDLQNLESVGHKLANHSLAEVSFCNTDTTEPPAEQQTGNINAKTHTSSTESVSLVEHLAATDCVNQYKENDTVSMNSCNKSSVSSTDTDRTAEVNVIGRSDELKTKQAEKQSDSVDSVHPLEDQRSEKHQTAHSDITTTLSFDCPLQKTPEEESYCCTAVETRDDTKAPADSAAKHLNVKSPARDSKGPTNPTTSPVRDKSEETKSLEHHSVHSQLLLSPPLASAPCPFITPHLPSSTQLSSPTLPSVGPTPHPALSLTSSPSAPSLSVPPPHSPSIQALSPPVLSPCPSFTSLPSSLPPASPCNQNPSSLDRCHRVDPPPCLTPSKIQSQRSGGLVNQGVEESAQEHMLTRTHTLKAPAGSCLVDACCVPGHSGVLRVAAAGKWAVSLWSQKSTSDWSLTHTWTFDEPVISVFSVPDAPELMCVTLGQLEIREVRMLSCSSLLQVLIHEGVVQTVVGVSKSRVVTSSYLATSSILQVFNLSDDSSTPSSQPLVSPGVCVGALAPVDGLSDALIGTDECRHLFIWNLKTGHLLQRVILGDDLSHTACLRGYSYCGVLFVLLHHPLLSSLEEEEKEAKSNNQMFSKGDKEVEKKMTAFFSLAAINPLSGKSVLATKLYPPKAWSGRLCEADVNSSSVVGLSQSGYVCVWELGCQRDPRMVWAPESEGWHLARWGGRDVLLTGHHNGDVTLHCYSQSLCH